MIKKSVAADKMVIDSYERTSGKTLPGFTNVFI